jgi:hypothetical protein
MLAKHHPRCSYGFTGDAEGGYGDAYHFRTTDCLYCASFQRKPRTHLACESDLDRWRVVPLPFPAGAFPSMKLKGKIKKKDQTEVDGFGEIIYISIVGTTVDYGVMLYYFEGTKQVYQNMDKKLTARYQFSLDPKDKDDIYTSGYKKLLLTERFKNFIII